MPHEWKYYHHDTSYDDSPHIYRCEKCGCQTSVSWPYGYPHPDKKVKWNKGKDPMTCEEITIKKVEQQ